MNAFSLIANSPLTSLRRREKEVARKWFWSPPLPTERLFFFDIVFSPHLGPLRTKLSHMEVLHLGILSFGQQPWGYVTGSPPRSPPYRPMNETAQALQTQLLGVCGESCSALTPQLPAPVTDSGSRLSCPSGFLSQKRAASPKISPLPGEAFPLSALPTGASLPILPCARYMATQGLASASPSVRMLLSGHLHGPRFLQAFAEVLSRWGLP